MPEVKWNRYMRSHNSGNIHGENLHIWAIERKKNSFLENQNIFSQKNYTTIIRTYWATKYGSRSESKFWVTPLFVWCMLALAPNLFVKMGNPPSHLSYLGMHSSTKFTTFSKLTLSLMNQYLKHKIKRFMVNKFVITKRLNGTEESVPVEHSCIVFVKHRVRFRERWLTTKNFASEKHA